MAHINQLYQTITDQILEQLAAGVRPWHRPWAVNPSGVSRPVRENGVPYQGINILILWMATLHQGYTSPYWMTYRQAQSLGAQVRRGERATHIVFAKTFRRREEDPVTGEQVDVQRPVRRAYAVFNTEQIDDLPVRYTPEPPPSINRGVRDARCDAWFASLGIEIRHGGRRAFYAPQPDRIQMPPFETFETPDYYLATLAHEAVHATGHRDRLDRFRGTIDEKARAREELVAEIGSAFLCVDLGITSSPREDHAAYIATWINLLKDEPRAVFDASTKAQQAVEFLHHLAGSPSAEAA